MFVSTLARAHRGLDADGSTASCDQTAGSRFLRSHGRVWRTCESRWTRTALNTRVSPDIPRTPGQLHVYHNTRRTRESRVRFATRLSLYTCTPTTRTRPYLNTHKTVCPPPLQVPEPTRDNGRTDGRTHVWGVIVVVGESCGAGVCPGNRFKTYCCNDSNYRRVSRTCIRAETRGKKRTHIRYSLEIARCRQRTTTVSFNGGNTLAPPPQCIGGSSFQQRRL